MPPSSLVADSAIAPGTKCVRSPHGTLTSARNTTALTGFDIAAPWTLEIDVSQASALTNFSNADFCFYDNNGNQVDINVAFTPLGVGSSTLTIQIQDQAGPVGPPYVDTPFNGAANQILLSYDGVALTLYYNGLPLIGPIPYTPGPMPNPTTFIYITPDATDDSLELFKIAVAQ